MTVLATDNFNRGNNADIGSNWDSIGSALAILNNELDSTGGDGAEVYNAGSFANDHWSQVTLKNPNVGGSGSGPGYGVCVRGTVAGGTYYRALGSTEGCRIDRFSGGTFQANIVNFTGGFFKFNHSDVIRLEARGNMLIVLRNGEFLCAGRDSTLATGRPGVVYSSTMPTAAAADDWSGGDCAGEVGYVGNMIAGTLGIAETFGFMKKIELPEPGLVTDIYAYVSDTGGGSHAMRAANIDIDLAGNWGRTPNSIDQTGAYKRPNITNEWHFSTGNLPTTGAWKRFQLECPVLMPAGRMRWLGIMTSGGSGTCELGSTLTGLYRQGHNLRASAGGVISGGPPVQEGASVGFFWDWNTEESYNVVAAYTPMTIKMQPDFMVEM